MNKPFAIIIEDDPKLGTIFQSILQQAGYETGLDPNGDRYEQMLAVRTPTLILLDVHLPYASGVEILQQLRTDERWKHLPIIVATADIFTAKTLQAKEEHVLVKPVSFLQLTGIATRYLPAPEEPE
jgi:DNA-binding response OmpR family regulator